MKTPAILCIMDGYGLGPCGRGNAIESARKPNLDKLFSQFESTSLQAGGRAVGLPEGQMGNSEVGHMNIGAGRVVWQDLLLISNAIDDGSFFENSALIEAAQRVKDAGTLHIFGLMSDGGVHSHIDHIKAIVKLAADRGAERISLHCFMDGRDTAPDSGAGYLREMESFLAELGRGKIASICGRYYAMDRDKRWDRIKLAYDMLVSPPAGGAESASECIESAYAEGQSDEFIKPTACEGFEGIKSGDSIIFANFRPDRAREITRAFTDPEFDAFERPEAPAGLFFVCMTQYDPTIPNVSVAYPPKELENVLGEYISGKGLRQLRIAETEKYAHVTFFFNGGRELPFEGEERILVPSPKVATYDLMPQMSAFEVAARAAERIKSKAQELCVINFANCDMVGHTGVFDATVKAVEAVDSCVVAIAEAAAEAKACLLLTADHGNADQMLDERGNVVTAHSLNPVPFIVCDYSGKFEGLPLREGGALKDIAPTILQILGIEKPEEMSGTSLFELL